MTIRPRAFVVALVIALACLSGTVFLLGRWLPRPVDRTITVVARKYGYEPAVIKVNRGDRVRLKLAARDVTHGFFLEAYDIEAQALPEMPTFSARHPSKDEAFQPVEEVAFVANREGKFRFRCSTICGHLHPFMQGELIVQPNRLFPVSILLSLATTVLTLLWFGRTEAR